MLGQVSISIVNSSNAQATLPSSLLFSRSCRHPTFVDSLFRSFSFFPGFLPQSPLCYLPVRLLCFLLAGSRSGLQDSRSAGYSGPGWHYDKGQLVFTVFEESTSTKLIVIKTICEENLTLVFVLTGPASCPATSCSSSGLVFLGSKAA